MCVSFIKSEPPFAPVPPPTLPNCPCPCPPHPPVPLPGVRTRQEGVVFVTCEDAEAVASQAQPLLGSRIRLTAGPNGVSVSPAGQGSAASSSNGSSAAANSNGNGASAAAKPAARAGAVEKVGSVTVVPLDEATVASCGAKAAACGELLRLAASCQDAVAAKALAAASNGGSNSTAIMASADGVVLPFGCMEAALAADGQQDRFADLLRQLASVLGSMQHDHSGHSSEGGLAALDAVCADIQGLLRGLRIPQAVSTVLVVCCWQEGRRVGWTEKSPPCRQPFGHTAMCRALTGFWPGR